MPAPIQLLFDLGLEDLNPIEVGESDNFPDRCVYPKSFNGTILHHVRSGCGDLYVGGRHFHVVPGQAFIILPGQESLVHYTADHNDPWEYGWISFTGKLAPRFSILPPVFEVPQGILPHTYGLEHATSAIGYLLAADLYELYAKVVDPLFHKTDIIPQILEHIDTHYMQNLTVDSFSTDFGIDRRELNRRFKARVGCSVRAYLTRVRMQHAERLLAQNCSIKETALSCGFGSASHFHKMFTAHHGQSPAQWKQLQTRK